MITVKRQTGAVGRIGTSPDLSRFVPIISGIIPENHHPEKMEVALSSRSLSPHQMFLEMATEHTPARTFDSCANAGFKSWKEEVLPKVIATLGKFPERVPLNPELLGACPSNPN